MKPGTIAAITIAAATTMLFISCSCSHKEKATSPYEKIEGTWNCTIDTAGHSITALLWRLANKDSSRISIEFGKDSVYRIKQGIRITDSGKIIIDTANAGLYVKHLNGTPEDSFHIEHFSDSLLQLTTIGKDSTQIKLTR